MLTRRKAASPNTKTATGETAAVSWRTSSVTLNARSFRSKGCLLELEILVGANSPQCARAGCRKCRSCLRGSLSPTEPVGGSLYGAIRKTLSALDLHCSMVRILCVALAGRDETTAGFRLVGWNRRGFCRYARRTIWRLVLLVADSSTRAAKFRRLKQLFACGTRWGFPDCVCP